MGSIINNLLDGVFQLNQKWLLHLQYWMSIKIQGWNLQTLGEITDDTVSIKLPLFRNWTLSLFLFPFLNSSRPGTSCVSYKINFLINKFSSFSPALHSHTEVRSQIKLLTLIMKNWPKVTWNYFLLHRSKESCQWYSVKPFRCQVTIFEWLVKLWHKISLRFPYTP